MSLNLNCERENVIIKIITQPVSQRVNLCALWLPFQLPLRTLRRLYSTESRKCAYVRMKRFKMSTDIYFHLRDK